ncbi:hypothetical protein LTS10_006040 [Elasticomyces elasticus]|nr:hypothetical protein LTS10_006040 [Elasticomyces elasticus]
MSTEALNNEKTAHNNTTPPTPPTSSWPHDAEKAAGQIEQNGPPQHPQQKPTEDGPAGGFDATPIPSRLAGYTLKITIHRATNLPMADLNSFSSDPYVLAQIDTETPTRHKEDPPVRHRTQTIRQNTEPVWNDEWIVANIPASGMKLKLRVYDEDPADKDDRLGNVHVHVDRIGDDWVGLREQSYEMKARMASKRAYLIRMVAVCMQTSKHLRGNLFVSIENLGRTQQDGQNGRIYTVGPCRWVRHYDPILGRIMGMKEPDEDGDEPKQVGEKQQKQQDSNKRNSGSGPKDKKKVQKYNFQANQLQLQGPVPAHLYHRYVEFRPFVKGMFTGSGVRGFILGKALHHQHARVYNFDRQTIWGNYTYPQNDKDESMTKQFLDLVHYDKGGRIFTHPRRPPPPDPIDSSSNVNDSHPPHDIPGGDDEDPPKDPAYYELVIDNDSGTYRPNAKLLPLLKEFLARALPGIHIQTLDCQADAEKMSKMKNEQRERKKKEGDNVIYMQGSRSSSISSSDEEDLERMEAEFEGGRDGHGHEDGVVGQAARDAKLKQQARWRKAKGRYGGDKRGGGDEDEGGRDEEGGGQVKGGAS